MTALGIAIAGAGYIGRRHVEAIAACPAARLVALVDPDPRAAEVAGQAGVPLVPSLDDLPEAAEAVILATPTGLHLEQARHCLERGLPVLIEKPVTVTSEEAASLAALVAARAVPVLVGHHRRHSPAIAAARAVLAEGRIGRVVGAHVSILFCKHDAYFEPDWRRRPGAGPILTNLVHEIDTLRYLLGEVEGVQATASSAIRGFEIEDSAAVILRFASGALATVLLSDAATTPWSWELTAGENPDYPMTGQSSTMISGTEGALEVPSLRLWQPEGPCNWYTPLRTEAVARVEADPFDRQIAHFVQVARGAEAPLVTVADAARTQAVLGAVLEAIEFRKEVRAA
jgi:predicted dehydrogenase